MHELVLNEILANDCPSTRLEGDLSLHTLDLHCNEAWIITKYNHDLTHTILYYWIAGRRTHKEMYDLVMKFIEENKIA